MKAKNKQEFEALRAEIPPVLTKKTLLGKNKFNMALDQVSKSFDQLDNQVGLSKEFKK